MSHIDEGISRRTLLGSALLAAAAVSTDGVAATPKRKPNFLFIMADDLGAFDLSCYGRTDYQTPHIDSLANDGMKFNLAYANSSSCAPTRVGLISGQYQNRLLVGTGFGGGYPSDKIGYPGHLPSLPNTLKRGGYKTGLIGKWDIGELPTYSPNKSGYDEFFGLMGGGFDYWAHDMMLVEDPDKRKPDLYENETPVEVEGYATDLFTDRACAFIERNAAQPFLLSLHYTAPHWPWQTRDDHGQPRISDFHYDGGSPQIYKEMMLALDQGVGRLLDTLRRLKLSNDTIIIFTSDNGGERFSKMWPLRGEKGDLWEGGTRVPLIVRWPGRIKPGSVSEQTAMSMDFLPTMAAIAGVATDPSMPPDGIDLSPQWLGAPPVGRTLFWKTPGDLLSAVAHPWKYLRRGKYEYLYNLAEDPTEHANYKLKNPAMFAKLKGEAEAWSAQMLDNLPSPPPDFFQTMEALNPMPKR